MLKAESLKKYIDEVIAEIEQELDEATATGDIAGYETPNAFSDGSDATKRRKKKIATQLGMQLVGKVESVNESLITEKQFKGLEGISATTPLTKITKDQKLKIVKGVGNIIDFIVPKGVSRNFWQVIGTGKVKKNLSGEYYLEGKMINSPTFKSIDDLINGVKWDSMEERRKFNESVSEATTSFVSGNSGRTITNLDNKKYQLTKDVKGAQIGNYTNVVLPKGSIIHNLPGGVFVSHPSLTDKFSGIKETPKFGFRVTTHPNTIVTIEKSSKILESVNEYNLSDIINQVKTYEKPKDAKLLTIKVINKLKDTRNKSNSSKKSEIQKIIDTIEGDYNKGKYLKLESINENRWLELKNDDSMHANKKLAVGLKELKNQLSEVEKFFRWYNQIKTMNELDSNQYWKRTNSHIYKIKERIINIARTLQEIEK